MAEWNQMETMELRQTELKRVEKHIASFPGVNLTWKESSVQMMTSWHESGSWTIPHYYHHYLARILGVSSRHRARKKLSESEGKYEIGSNSGSFPYLFMLMADHFCRFHSRFVLQMRATTSKTIRSRCQIIFFRKFYSNHQAENSFGGSIPIRMEHTFKIHSRTLFSYSRMLTSHLFCIQ